MKRRRGQSSSRGKTTRRWHIPPPLVHGPEALEAGSVLEEFPSQLGVILWQAARDVMLWAETPCELRAGLFASEAARDAQDAVERLAEAELTDPLGVLVSLLANPEKSEAVVVATSCARIVRWAEGRDAPRTAIVFAQCTALAEPANADAAFSVARIAMRLADHSRAEVWFRRAVGLARQAQDWRHYARAFSGLGNLYLMRGNLPAAQRFHIRALRGARRGGVRAEEAAALHDLFGVAIEMGRTEDGERYAREAALAYGRRNARLAALAHDVGYLWMQQGHFSRALAVFKAVLPLMEDPVERLFVEADLVRAAAGAGEDHLAAETARLVLEKAERPELSRGTARALLEVGRGALHLRDLGMAETAARRANQVAARRSEGKTMFEAETLLDAIGSARVSAQPIRPAPPAAPDRESDGLAEELIRSLTGMSERAGAL